MAGAPKGNQNAAKPGKLIADTLRRVAVQNPEKIRKACEKLLDKMEEGDIVAFREFADRIDGKAVQSTEMTLTQGSSAERLDDDQLADIATGSSQGAAEPQKGKTPVH